MTTRRTDDLSRDEWLALQQLLIRAGLLLLDADGSLSSRRYGASSTSLAWSPDGQRLTAT